MALRLSGDGSLNLSDVTLDNVTASGLSASGTVSLPPTTSIGNVSDTEIAFVDGVTSALQTQLNAKADKAAGYQYVTTLYITSNATFEKGFALKLADPSSNDATPWLRAIRVKVQGAGGGGAGATTTSSNQVSPGGGGSSGEYREVFISDIGSLSASVTVTIGSGGTGGSGVSGTAGGKSVFGSVEAEGGGRGVAVSAGAAPRNSPASDAAGTGGAGSADLTIAGQRGQQGFASVTGLVISGRGANSVLGLGGVSLGFSSFSTGNSGAGFGSGGGGALNGENQATARTGGFGRAGIVIVELYA